MALTGKQMQGICRMFAIAFVHAENEKVRKKIMIDFEDAFSTGIANWKELCGEQISKLTDDKVIIEEYINLSTRNVEDNKIKCDIRLICKEDFEQVRDIVNEAFDLSITKSDEDKYDYFVKNGFSFVAHSGEEILGVILANIEHDLAVPAVYVNNFAVAEGFRGRGIGKALFTHLKKHAHEKNMFLMKLQTKPDIEAFEIYKHWGMKESGMVQMRGYCI